MPANDKPKRNTKPVIRLIDEHDKYTTGKYHGWKDTYDREYNGGEEYNEGENNNMGYKRYKTSKYALPY